MRPEEKTPTVVIPWQLPAAVLALFLLSYLFAVVADRIGAKNDFTTEAIVESVNGRTAVVSYENGYGEWVTRQATLPEGVRPGDRYPITLRSVTPDFVFFMAACVLCRVLMLWLILRFLLRQRKPRRQTGP